jgi:hypothetical protein
MIRPTSSGRVDAHATLPDPQVQNPRGVSRRGGGPFKPAKGDQAQVEILHSPQTELTLTFRFKTPASRDAMAALAQHMPDVETVSVIAIHRRTPT